MIDNWRLILKRSLAYAADAHGAVTRAMLIQPMSKHTPLLKNVDPVTLALWLTERAREQSYPPVQSFYECGTNVAEVPGESSSGAL